MVSWMVNFLPEREPSCPPSHSHSDNCYRKHGCRCSQCRSANNKSIGFYRMGKRMSRNEVDSVLVYRAARRLQALAYIGWSSADIELMIGVEQSHLSRIRRGEFDVVKLETFNAIDRAYRQMCVTPNYSAGSKFTKANARKLDYKSALYWEDIDRDSDRGYRQYA